MSAPVWTPDMILVSLIRKILDVRRKFKGVDLEFQDFVFRAHIIRFSWKLADEERNSGENQKKRNFSDTQQVKAARCKLLFFQKISDAMMI